MEKVRVTQTKSGSSRQSYQKATLRRLGLKRIRDSVEVETKPEILGMIRKVSHLVSVETLKGSKS